jgi:hypothetical protein
MDQEDSVQKETPKTRIGDSQTASPPDVSKEPAFSEVPSYTGSQPVRLEDATETERTNQKDPDMGEPTVRHRSPKLLGPLPLVLSTRPYGHTYVKMNGQTGGSLCFRLSWQRLRTANGVGFEEEKFYRVSGAVEDVFAFQVHFLASGRRQILIYVPVKYVDRIRPLEVRSVTISSVEEIETKKPVGELVDGIHVSSWRRFAKSKLVDEESEEDFGDGPPRQLNEIERAWLAGVIDGEGSIFLVKLTGGLAAKTRRGYIYVPVISLGSSSEAFARKVKEIIGKGSVNFIEERRLNWKDKWYYRCGGLVVRGLLPQLVPCLLIKREVAERMIRYLAFVDANPIDGPMATEQSHFEKMDSLYLDVKESNEKGKDVSAEALVKMLALPKSLKNRGRGGRATDCRKMSEEESAWLAGVVDGEGSIFLSKVTNPAYRRGFFYRPQLNVSNSNRSFLVKVMEIVGEGTVHLARRGDERTKTRWEYNATAGVLRKVLPQIVGYLIVKREMAEKTLEYFDYIDANPIYGRRPIPQGYYERLDELYWIIKKLNEKGKPVSETRKEGE